MDFQSIANGLQWIGGGFLSLLALIGIGNIIMKLLTWTLDRKEKRDAINETNAGKSIDQDQNAFASMEKRLDKLTERFDELQQKYADLMADHAGIKKENEFLTRDNERLQREVEDLRKENTTRAGRITQLEKQVKELMAKIEGMQK